MVARFDAAPDHLHVQPTAGTQAVLLQRLEAEVAELWSFVGKKAQRQWVRMAMNASPRQVVAFHVGDRSRQGAATLASGNPVGLIVSSEVKGYGEASGKSTVEGRAQQTAKEIAAHLKTRFAEEGWI